MTKEARISAIEAELAILKQEVIEDSPYLPKYWRPVHGKYAWYIAFSGIVSSNNWDNRKINTDIIKVGNIFPTEQEANQQFKLMLATQRLKEAIWIANGGRLYEFTPGEVNWCITLNTTKLFTTIWRDYKCWPNWFYVKDGETAKQLLREHRTDFETYFEMDCT